MIRTSLLPLLLLAACAEEQRARPDAKPEPPRITVEHILIGVKGQAMPTATRDVARARKLAYQLAEKAKAGGDFTALRKRYSEDPGGGVYKMANHGVTKHGAEYERSGMVPAFGNVGFRLDVNEIAVADYDPKASPFGFHVIKRVE